MKSVFPRWQQVWALGLSAPLACVACRREAPPDLQTGPEVVMVDTPSKTGANIDASEDAPGGLDHTVITLATGNVEVALRDGDALRAALVQKLRASDVADRDELLQWTEHAKATIDADGVFRLGTWVLGEHLQELALTNRFRQTQSAMLIYVATVSKAGGAWTVKQVEQQIVHARR